MPIHIEAGLHGAAETVSCLHLFNLACVAAQQFRSLGLVPGDRVVTLLPTGRPLLQCIFGAWAAGAVISVLAPSIDRGRSSLSLDRLEAMLRIVRPRVIVTSGNDRATIAGVAAGIGAVVLDATDLNTDVSGAVPPPLENLPDEPAVIQFTSGSTGLPKAVVIDHGQMIQNARTTAEWTGFGSADCFVSWLPIHHDFGFVIGLCMPLICGAKLVLIPTETFTRNPLNWLKVMSDYNATYTGAPASGAALLTKSIFVSRATGVDLSSLKYICLGAEPVSLSVVEDFERLYARNGLKQGSVAAAYGMAETTLTVSARAYANPRRVTYIDKQRFHGDGVVELSAANKTAALALLGNGSPLPGVRVRIIDPGDREVPDGQQGRIVVSSSMVTKRYFGSDENPQPGGWFDTGDLGFLLDGEVYVTGTSKDVIIKNGVNMPAHLIEDAVLTYFSDVVTRSIAFSVPSERDLRDEVIVGVELRRESADEALPMEIRAALQTHLNFSVDRVILLPKGSIPRTTSGKLQRATARELYRRGELALPTKEEVA